MIINSLPDVIVSGTPQQLSSVSLLAKWVLLSNNSGVLIRVGDSSVAVTSQGVAVPPNGAIDFPQDSSCHTAMYDLSQIYAIGSAGAKLGIVYGT